MQQSLRELKRPMRAEKWSRSTQDKARLHNECVQDFWGALFATNGAKKMGNQDHKPPDAHQEMTKTQMSLVDKVLMTKVKARWAKAALIIANAMTSAELIDLEFSDEVYAERLKELLKAGQIEVQGSLDRIRFCEVRKLGV